MHFLEHFCASKYNYTQHILLIKNYFGFIPFLMYKRLFLRKRCVIHMKQKLNKMLLKQRRPWIYFHWRRDNVKAAWTDYGSKPYTLC